MSMMKAQTVARNPFTTKVNQRIISINNKSASGVSKRQVTRAAYETQIIMTAANFSCLALGRWAFLPYQRRNVENAGMPVQNGQTHFEAGDRYAQEVTFLTSSNDPAGFNLIDVMAWGSIGHVLGFIILATNPALGLGNY